MVKTPGNGSRQGSVDPQRPGSINFREMQGKLHSIRERMKSQGGTRFKPKASMFSDTHIQGGFQTGFIQLSQQ